MPSIIFLTVFERSFIFQVKIQIHKFKRSGKKNLSLVLQIFLHLDKISKISGRMYKVWKLAFNIMLSKIILYTNQ